MFSVEFSADLVEIQVRETVFGVFLAQMDIPTQVWHMVEVMRMDFNENHITQVSKTENQLEIMQMMEEGTVDNPITIEEDEGFSEPRTPASEPPKQPPVMEARPLICNYFGCCLVFYNLFFFAPSNFILKRL